MKTQTRILLSAVLCLALAAGAYFWANGQMNSLFAFRSPISATPPQPVEPLGDRLSRQVVFVLIDALREDTSLDPQVMPYLNELRPQGAWATMHSRPPSYSQPGYAVLLTGAWPELSDGPAMNVDYADIWNFTQDDLFSAAHRAGLKTAVSGFNWFEKLIPPDAVDASFYTAGEDQAADRDVVDAALPWIASGEYGLVLVHIDQVDYAGHHEGGPQDPHWNEAARRSDDLLREIVAKMDLSQDTLLVASDHGQIDQGGHGGQDPITLVEPFLLVGAGVTPGVHTSDIEMVDLAPTLGVLMGANLPASAQGRPLLEVLNLTSDQIHTIDLAHQAQQTRLYDAYASAVTVAQPSPLTWSDVNSAQLAIDNIRISRLASERLPRLLLALLIGALPGMLFLRNALKPGHLGDRSWLVTGALVFVAAFNLKYTLLDRKTYSLSSVLSATDLVISSAITAVIALLIAWLVYLLGRRIYRLSPGAAAASTLDLALATVWVLALPVLLSFAINGASATWTLPEFSTWFLGFISLVQILMVAVLVLPFAVLSALVAAIANRRKKIAVAGQI